MWEPNKYCDPVQLDSTWVGHEAQKVFCAEFNSLLPLTDKITQYITAGHFSPNLFD